MCQVGGNLPAESMHGNDDDVQKVVLDVPEIDTQEILGEWLIPRGEALLVSFGAHTVADKDGMAVVKERLAIIEADEASTAIAMIAPKMMSATPNPRAYAGGHRERADRTATDKPPRRFACSRRTHRNPSFPQW